jgi:hypothetical protein
MSRLLTALLGAALVSMAVPATAHHVPEDARMAAAEAKMDAASKLVGTFKVLLDEETKKKLEETKKKVAEAGSDDAMASEMLKMMEAMSNIVVTFTKTEMTMSFAEQSETVTYTVSKQTGDTVTLKTSGTKNAPEGSENFTIKLTDAGLVMSKEGDEQTITFLRQK